MNLLNTTHNLFATEDAFITLLWSTSSLAIDGPASASVMLVAAEYAGRSPWFMVKSSLVNFVRNLEPTRSEREIFAPSLKFRDQANAIQFCVEKSIYQLTFKSPGPYWCLKYYFASNGDYYDWHRGSGLDEQTLLQAFSTFTIPGELPSGIRGIVPENNGNFDHAQQSDHPRAGSVSDDSTSVNSDSDFNSSSESDDALSVLSADPRHSPQTSPIDNHPPVSLDANPRSSPQTPPINMDSGAFDEDDLQLLYPDDFDGTNPEPQESNRIMPVPDADVKMDGVTSTSLVVSRAAASGTSLSNRIMGLLTRLGTDTPAPPQLAEQYRSVAGDLGTASVAHQAASSGSLKRPNAWPSESAPKRCKRSH